MAAKRAPTTQHRLTLKKLSDTLTTTHTYISKGGGSGSRNKKISQVLNRNDPLRSATLRYAITCKPSADSAATPHETACLGLNRC